MLHIRSRVVALLSVLGVGCQGVSDPELENATGTVEAESASGRYTFYIALEQDFRKCAYPGCGGAYVKRVNVTKTRCANGAWETECRVFPTFEGLGFSDEEIAELEAEFLQGDVVVRGKIAYEGNVPTLSATEVWRAALDWSDDNDNGNALPSGQWYRVSEASSGFKEEKLNSSKAVYSLKAFDLDSTGADEVQIDTALEQLPTGILASGYHSFGELVTTEFYTEVLPGGNACVPSSDEYNREYTYTSEWQCDNLNVTCGKGTTAFSNECGCGCEQPWYCPEKVYCATGSSCKLKYACPLSSVTYY